MGGQRKRIQRPALTLFKKFQPQLCWKASRFSSDLCPPFVLSSSQGDNQLLALSPPSLPLPPPWLAHPGLLLVGVLHSGAVSAYNENGLATMQRFKLERGVREWKEKVVYRRERGARSKSGVIGWKRKYGERGTVEQNCGLSQTAEDKVAIENNHEGGGEWKRLNSQTRATRPREEFLAWPFRP